MSGELAVKRLCLLQRRGIYYTPLKQKQRISSFLLKKKKEEEIFGGKRSEIVDVLLGSWVVAFLWGGSFGEAKGGLLP